MGRRLNQPQKLFAGLIFLDGWYQFPLSHQLGHGLKGNPTQTGGIVKAQGLLGGNLKFRSDKVKGQVLSE